MKITVDILKDWNSQNKISDDRRFIKFLLVDIFGIDTLKKSSLFGNISNTGHFHEPLNAVQIEFIRQIFKVRVNSDKTRMARINQIINRHCNNARKHK